MPVVHVRALDPDDTGAVGRLFESLARDVSEACSCPAGSVWSTFTPIARMALGSTEIAREDRIVYVDLLMRPRGDEVTGAALRAVAHAASAELDVPLEDVWATFTPVEPGRAFAGGDLIGD